MADDDRVPDTSGPASLGEVFKSFAHGATDPDALMSALKASRMPSVPLSQIGDAVKAGSGMRWCQRCRRPEPENAGCPNAGFGDASPEKAMLPLSLGEVFLNFPRSQAGTTCAACSGRGITTFHSPAGEEHADWEAKWARNPDWMPEGVTAFSPILPVPIDPLRADTAAGRRRWDNAPGGMALPSDPFPDTDVLAGLGIAQMLDAMEAGGVPPLRAERIVGAMLAAHGIMAKEAQGDDEG